MRGQTTAEPAEAAAAIPQAIPPKMTTWRAYLVRCIDGSLYAGVSTDVKARVAAHNTGKGARYTRARRPVVLAWRSSALTKVAAHRLEWQLKQLLVQDKRILAGAASPKRTQLTRRLLALARHGAAAVLK